MLLVILLSNLAKLPNSPYVESGGPSGSLNPNKVARSTVGVASLVVPDWLIEIEAVAVFPE